MLQKVEGEQFKSRVVSARRWHLCAHAHMRVFVCAHGCACAPWGGEWVAVLQENVLGPGIRKESCCLTSTWMFLELQEVTNPRVPVFCCHKKDKGWSTHENRKFQFEVIVLVARLNFMAGYI